MLSTNYYATCIKTSNQTTIQEATISTYVKDIDLDAHIKVFNKAIKANGEIVEVDIINMFSFTFRDNIFKIS